MKTLYIKNSDTYRKIFSNDKKIEVRKKSKFIDSLLMNEEIIIKCGDHECKKRIIYIKSYKSLRELLKASILSEINSNLIDIKSGIQYYGLVCNYQDPDMPYYSIRLGNIH